MSDGITFERDGAVAKLTLDRPDVGNAIDIPMARALMEAATACDEDAGIRCVLLTGAGKLFCAGGDVAAFSAAGDGLPVFLKEITTYIHAAISRFSRMDKPLVTAVNGAAAGAGFSLSILGDIVLADPRAKFMLAYAGIGMSPDGGSTWLLPRLVGLRKAQELCLRNTMLDAAGAVEAGLATSIAADGELANEANALAQELAAGPTHALGATRRLLLDSFSNTLETQMELESRSIAAMGGDPQGREGIDAFVAKRSPNFHKDD